VQSIQEHDQYATLIKMQGKKIGKKILKNLYICPIYTPKRKRKRKRAKEIFYSLHIKNPLLLIIIP
jgi:hypothetical protein